VKVIIDSTVKGSYILLVELSRIYLIRTGALGLVEFPQGFYAYVGSALGGVQARLNHHLRRMKKVRWHIDYLLREGEIKEMIYCVKREKLECHLAHRLEETFRSFPAFGSSDCRCTSHLFFSSNFKVLRKGVIEAFRDVLRGEEPLAVNI